MAVRPTTEIERYRDRHTWLSRVTRLGGWRLKVYCISVSGGDPAPGCLDLALAQVEAALPEPTDEAVACGFVQIHLGTEATWLLVDLWHQDILKHHHFRGALESDPHFEPHHAKDGMACVWELAVICHERSAWIRHVLARPEAPDLDAYLADGLTIKP